MVLKVFLKFPPTLVLVHGWLFPVLLCFQRTWEVTLPEKQGKLQNEESKEMQKAREWGIREFSKPSRKLRGPNWGLP